MDEKTTQISVIHLLVYGGKLLQGVSQFPVLSLSAFCIRISDLAERYIKITCSQTDPSWLHIWEGSGAWGQHRATYAHKMSPEPPASDVSMQRFSGSGAFDQTTPLLGELFSFSLSLSLPPPLSSYYQPCTQKQWKLKASKLLHGSMF